MCFETIQFDSSNVNLVRDEAFANLQVELPNVNHPKPCAQSESRYWSLRKHSAFIRTCFQTMWVKMALTIEQ